MAVEHVGAAAVLVTRVSGFWILTCNCLQALLKKPELKQLTRKNEIRPFEDAASLEFLCEKNECAAFLYSSHNKKRPNNLVLVRIQFRRTRQFATSKLESSAAAAPAECAH